jgi:hypothetical protein
MAGAELAANDVPSLIALRLIHRFCRHCANAPSLRGCWTICRAPGAVRRIVFSMRTDRQKKTGPQTLTRSLLLAGRMVGGLLHD